MEYSPLMKNLRQVVLIWLIWSVFIIVYMQFSFLNTMQFSDYQGILSTLETLYDTQVYLREPFLNSIVAWDSEFYLSVATIGYGDTNVSHIQNQEGESYTKNHAFFPLYPYLMKVVRLPFVLFGLNPIAASTLAGLIVSLLGTLGGLLALYDLCYEELGEDGALRAVVMMLIFPTSFFFVTVYTEALFVGLAFGSLAMLRRKQWLIAACLASFATWTRPIGIVLFLPMVLSWCITFYKTPQKGGLLLRFPLLFTPLLAYSLWRLFFGYQFDLAQAAWFGNQLFNIQATFEAWQQNFGTEQSYPAAPYQSALGLVAVLFAALSCLLNWQKHLNLAVFGFLALLIPMISGASAGTDSAIRYVLVVPTLWITLGRWSGRRIFAYSWILLSITLLLLYTLLFSTERWVA
jgi:hypothetical protein